MGQFFEMIHIVKSVLFQFRHLAKGKPVVWRQDSEKVIHSFIVTCLDYCSRLYTRVEPGFALLFAPRLLIGADTVTVSTFLLFWTSSSSSLCTSE